MNSYRYELYWYETFHRYHVNKYRAISKNRDELVPEWNLYRYHVNISLLWTSPGSYRFWARACSKSQSIHHLLMNSYSSWTIVTIHTLDYQSIKWRSFNKSRTLLIAMSPVHGNMIILLLSYYRFIGFRSRIGSCLNILFSSTNHWMVFVHNI